jgi:hypothetical protein
MSSRRWLLVLALALLAGVAFGIWRELRRAPEPAAPPPGASLPAPSEPPAAETPTPAPAAPAAAAPELPPLGLGGVDLEEVRAALPDNLYWQTAAPTDDPRVIEEREREADLRNVQYGKVLSGTGTDEELVDYYDYRMRASTDYVAFADYLLEHYGSELNDQDQTLLHLARKLHLARLEEIPRKLQEARDRKAEQDEARRKWLEDEKAFQSDSESLAPDAE